MNAWDTVQERLRHRRDRLESPLPAHDLLIADKESRSAWAARLCRSNDLGLCIVEAMLLAEMLEIFALKDGSLWARQQVDEALIFALRLAARLCERKEEQT